MFMLFLMSMISRLFAVRLCSSVVSLFTAGHVRRFIYYFGELMGLIACPYPSIVYEAMFLRAVVGLAAAATKMLAILALARHLIFTVIRPCPEFCSGQFWDLLLWQRWPTPLQAKLLCQNLFMGLMLQQKRLWTFCS